MKILFRIENHKGVGPFSCYYGYLGGVKLTGAELPVILYELLDECRVSERVFREKYLCAVESIDHLKKWFKDYELIKLKILGFKVVKIEVDDSKKDSILKTYSGIQVAYKKDRVIKKEEIV